MPGRLSTLRAQQDPILSRFAVGFNPPPNLIGPRVAPVVNVLKESGTFYTFGKEGFRIYNSERALRADPKRIDWEPGKDTFLCTEHALETMYDHEELDEARRIGAQAVLRMEQRAIQLTQNSLANEEEKAVADIVFAGANYATGNKITLSGTSQWKVSGGGEGSASTPITNLRDGINALRADIGRRANTLVFGYDAWQGLIDHTSFKELIKYSQKAIITEELVAQVLGVKTVMVGESVYSADGTTFTDLWGDNVAILYLPQPGELVEGTTPHTVQFQLNGFPKVKTYQDAYRKFYGVQRKYQVKNINTSYGYLIIDTNA